MSPERTGLVRAPGSAGVPLKSLRAGKRADIVPPSPRAAAEKRLFFFVGSFRAREPSCGSWVCAKTGRKRGARRLWSLERPGRCSWLPPLPLSLAAVRLPSAPAPPGSSRESEPGVPGRWKLSGPHSGPESGRDPDPAQCSFPGGVGGSSTQPPRHVPASSLPVAWAT